MKSVTATALTTLLVGTRYGVHCAHPLLNRSVCSLGRLQHRREFSDRVLRRKTRKENRLLCCEGFDYYRRGELVHMEAMGAKERDHVRNQGGRVRRQDCMEVFEGERRECGEAKKKKHVGWSVANRSLSQTMSRMRRLEEKQFQHFEG